VQEVAVFSSDSLYPSSDDCNVNGYDEDVKVSSI